MIRDFDEGMEGLENNVEEDESLYAEHIPSPTPQTEEDSTSMMTEAETGYTQPIPSPDRPDADSQQNSVLEDGDGESRMDDISDDENSGIDVDAVEEESSGVQTQPSWVESESNDEKNVFGE